MFIFEKLRPFVWMCHCFGVFPFFMETDPLAKKFKKFAFSWKRPVTWWFILILIGELLFLITDLIRAWRNYFEESVMNSTLPTIFAVFIFLEHFFFFMLIAMTRAVVILKSSQFHRIFCLIQKAHNLLCQDEDLSIEKIPSVNRQVIAGFIYAVVSAVGFIWASSAQIYTAANKHGTIYAYILPITWFFLIVSITLSFLLMYYSYYVIANYFDIISIYLKLPKSSLRMIVPKTTMQENRALMKHTLEWNDKLKLSKKAFCYLCNALTELNDIFSLPALLFLVLRLVSTAYCLYITIYSLLSNNPFLQNLAPQTAAFALIGFINILVVFRAADMPINQIKNLREKIFVISCDKTLDVEEEIQVLSFVQQCCEDRIRLSAAGLFNVGMHLLPSLTGAIVTYLIILLQSKIV